MRAAVGCPTARARTAGESCVIAIRDEGSEIDSHRLGWQCESTERIATLPVCAVGARRGIASGGESIGG